MKRLLPILLLCGCSVLKGAPAGTGTGSNVCETIQADFGSLDFIASTIDVLTGQLGLAKGAVAVFEGLCADASAGKVSPSTLIPARKQAAASVQALAEAVLEQQAGLEKMGLAQKRAIRPRRVGDAVVATPDVQAILARAKALSK